MATATRASLPPGPTAPKAVQALRYTYRFHALTAAEHARHGDDWTLRLPGLPDAVVTADRALVQALMTGDPLTRRHANDILEPALGDRSLLLLEPAPHLERRKLLLPPFHGERIAGYRAIMRELVDPDMDGWATDGPVRVHDHARALTLQVIQRIVLGTRDPTFEAELTRLLDVFDTPLANFGLFAPAFGRRARWNVLSAPFWRTRDRLDALMAGLIADARADPALPERTDVLALLLRARDADGEGLSDADLNDELKTLLAAGHETTATAIAWAADLFAHDPDAAAASAADPAAAAKELLRLRSIVPVCSARTLLEPLGGLPAGTVVLVDAYTLHNDPGLHPDPGAFRPARFADGGPPPYAYLPFGGGAHRCLGAALAMLELEVAMQRMAERFAFAPAGAPATPVRRGPTFIPSGGAAVRVRRR